jgi:hypothetical protein
VGDSVQRIDDLLGPVYTPSNPIAGTSLEGVSDGLNTPLLVRMRNMECLLMKLLGKANDPDATSMCLLCIISHGRSNPLLNQRLQSSSTKWESTRTSSRDVRSTSCNLLSLSLACRRNRHPKHLPAPGYCCW